MNKLLFLSLLLISSITCFADPKIIIQTNNDDQNDNQIELTQDSIKFLMQSITFKNMLNGFQCFGEIDDIDDIDNLNIDDLLQLLNNNSKDSENNRDDIIPLPDISKTTFNQIMQCLEPLAEIATLKTELKALEGEDKNDKELEIEAKESEIIQMLQSYEENDLFNVVEATSFLNIPRLLDYSCKAYSNKYELESFKNNKLSFDNREIIKKLKDINISSIKSFLIKQYFENYAPDVKIIRHARDVVSASYSPDGTQVVSASLDETVRIWDATTGECLHTLIGHDREVDSASYSPDGTQVVSASWDNTLSPWDATTGECLHTLEGHTDKVISASYSPDGTQIISASLDRTVRIWNAKTGECLHTLRGHTGRITSASYSPDGTQVVSASWDKTVRIWDATTGQCLHTLIGHDREVESASYSPDGTQVVSASWDNTLRIWDIGKPARDLENLTYEQILLHTLCKEAIETNESLTIVNNPHLLNIFNSLPLHQQGFLKKITPMKLPLTKQILLQLYTYKKPIAAAGAVGLGSLALYASYKLLKN